MYSGVDDSGLPLHEAIHKILYERAFDFAVTHGIRLVLPCHATSRGYIATAAFGLLSCRLALPPMAPRKSAYSGICSRYKMLFPRVVFWTLRSVFVLQERGPSGAPGRPCAVWYAPNLRYRLHTYCHPDNFGDPPST